jgi:hypothetical protein
VMLSGVRWQKCKSCPRNFAVLVSSARSECLPCEHKRKSLNRRRRKFPQP